MRIARAAALALVVAVAVAPAARAQKPKGGGGMSIGPWAGVNFATLSGTNLGGITFSTRTVFAAGGEFQTSLGSNLFLRVGALYSMRGAEATEAGIGATIKASYLEIPARLGYTFSMPGSGIRPFVLAGGQFAVKLSCDIDSQGTTTDCDTALGSNVSGTDFGLVFGGGVAFAAGSGSIIVDARYLIGLSNLISSSTTSETLKNQGFTIGAGYMIPIGH